jgi:hypothetical protein
MFDWMKSTPSGISADWAPAYVTVDWHERWLQSQEEVSRWRNSWLQREKEIRTLNRSVFEKSKIKKLLRHEREVNKQLRLELVDRIKEMDDMKRVIIEMEQLPVKMPVQNDRAS